MKLEFGKFYKERRGGVTGPIEPIRDGFQGDGWLFQGRDSSGLIETFTITGRVFSEDIDMPGDLVEEVENFAPRLVAAE